MVSSNDKELRDEIARALHERLIPPLENLHKEFVDKGVPPKVFIETVSKFYCHALAVACSASDSWSFSVGALEGAPILTVCMPIARDFHNQEEVEKLNTLIETFFAADEVDLHFHHEGQAEPDATDE